MFDAALFAFSYVEQYGWALASAAHMCTVYVTVLVAVHRFVYVCRPHDTERLSGLRRAKLHVAAVPLFAFFYNLPRVFEYKLSVSGSGGGNDAVSTVEITTQDSSDSFATVISVSHEPCERDKLQFSAIGGSPWFQIAYKNVCFYLFMYIIPLTTLVFVTFRLIATLRMRKNNKYRKSVVACPATAGAVAPHSTPPATMLNRRQQSRDDNVTIVLIIVIAVFIVCQTPTLVQRLLLAVTGIDSRACGHPYYYIERLADYLAIFNSCVNFVVYVIFAPRFRRILVNEVLPMTTSGWSSSSCCCCGVARRGGHRCSRSIGGATACGDNKGRSGTGGSDYCSEMAECFGVSSSQQFDSSAKDNYQHQQQQQQNASVVGLKTVATVATCGRCEATIIAGSSNIDRKHIHRVPLTSSSAVGTTDDVEKDEISSSISSAGSSSILPSIQCYGGLCDTETADRAT